MPGISDDNSRRVYSTEGGRVPEPRDPASTVALADRADEARADELLDHWFLVAELDRLPADEADVLRRRFYLEQSQTEIAAETGQSVAATSHHLRLLAKSGLARSRRDGRRIFYALASDRVAELWAAVRDVASRHVAEVAVLADEYLGSRDEVELLTASELVHRLADGSVVVLDVRPEAEFRAGHIAGARSAPLALLEGVAAATRACASNARKPRHRAPGCRRRGGGCRRALA